MMYLDGAAYMEWFNSILNAAENVELSVLYVCRGEINVCASTFSIGLDKRFQGLL